MDKLSLQYGKPYQIIGQTIAYQPTLKEIVEIGYDRYSLLVSSLVTSSKDLADVLFEEAKIWYEDIKSEWEFFIQRGLPTATTQTVEFNLKDFTGTVEALLLNATIRDGLNFFFHKEGEYVYIQRPSSDNKQHFMLVNCFKNKNGLLMASEDNFKFTETVYYSLVDFLREINWLTDNYEFQKGGTTNAKKVILKHLYKQRKRKRKSDITLDSIISGLIGRGISYSEIWNFPIYMVYDCYYRLCKIDAYKNTMDAYNSGNIDTKKHPINWEKINWATVVDKTQLQ